jgi:hypothetical protein
MPTSGDMALPTNGVASSSMGLGQNHPLANQITGTGTVFFITKSQVPKDRKVTYANFVCTIRPQKTETHRVRMTAGGDKLDYPRDASSPTVPMLDAKIHINSTISDAKQGARHLGLDIKNYIIGTPMAYFQYLRVPQSVIPPEVWDDPRYTIAIVNNGYVYLEIRRGMYGLKKPPSSRSTSLSRNSLLPAMNPCLSRQASGVTAQNAQHSSSVLTILASSISPKQTQCTSSTPSKPTTTSQLTGPVNYTAASVSTGTTAKDT